jgi:hypothetical protein
LRNQPFRGGSTTQKKPYEKDQIGNFCMCSEAEKPICVKTILNNDGKLNTELEELDVND